MSSDPNTVSDELSIGDRMDRLEEIAETLEAGAVDLDRAKELRTEADSHLSALRTELDIDGKITDIELDDPETTD